MKHFLPLILIVSAPIIAAVNDVLPTDYIANRPGESFATLYFKESDSDGYYRNGTKLINDSVSLSAQALRLGHTTELFGYTTSFTAVGAYAKTTFDGAVVEALYPKTTSGMSDIRLGMTTWLLNKPSEKEYLALTPMIFFPTGEYDSSRAFNIGENRFKATLGAGYVNRFMKNDVGELFLEISPELAVYGNNNDAKGKKLEQAPSYALTSYLRYHPLPILDIFTGCQINGGSETSVNGVEQNDQPNNTRLMFGGSFVLYRTQIMFRHAYDTGIHTGFKTGNETMIRLQWSL